MAVRNDKRPVVTSNGAHTAFATFPDICEVAGSPAPYANSVSSARLKNGTIRTDIDRLPIATTASTLGPPSDPAHPPIRNGIRSGTSRAEARAIKGSDSLVIEGGPVVRAQDATWQNHANTRGVLMASNWKAPDVTQGYKRRLDKYDLDRIMQYADPSEVDAIVREGVWRYREGGTEALGHYFADEHTPRYTYDPELGWIDLQHVSAAAAVTRGNFRGAGQLAGFVMEAGQLFSGYWGSVFHTEDLISNAIGDELEYYRERYGEEPNRVGDFSSPVGQDDAIEILLRGE